MRRSVKAWGLVLKRPDGSVEFPPDFISQTRALARTYREPVVPRGYAERIVPRVVTFDDGRTTRRPKRASATKRKAGK